MRYCTALCLALILAGLLGCGSSPAPPSVIIVEVDTAPPTGAKEPPGRGKPVSHWIAAMRDPDNRVNSEASGMLVQIGQPATSALLEMLNDPDEALRRRAHITIVRIGGPAVPELIAALGNDSVNARVVPVLADIGDDSIAPLIEAVEHQDAKVRAQACLVLREIAAHDSGRPSPKDAVTSVKDSAPALCKALKDKEPAVSAAAAGALALISGGAEAVPDLTAALKDAKNIELRTNAARALGRIGPDARDAAPALLEALKDSDEKARAAAAGALGRVSRSPDGSPKGVVPALRATLTDEKASVRIQAANSLGHLQSPSDKVVPDLIQVLKKEKNAAARQSLAAALGRYGERAKEAVPTLAPLLDDKDPNLCIIVARSLVDIGEAGLPALSKAAKSPHPKVREIALEALVKAGAGSGTADVVLAYAEMLKAEDDKSRLEAATVLGKFGPRAKGAVPALGEALEDTNSAVRVAAAESLGKIGKAAVPVLIRALQNESDEVRGLAAHGLAEAGQAARGAVPDLALMLVAVDAKGAKKHSLKTRENAAFALGKIGPAAKDAVPELMQALQEKQPPTENYSELRRHASAALANIGEPAIKPLVAALENTNPNVAFLARDAVKKMGKPAVPELVELVTNGKTRFGRERAIILLGELGRDAADAIPALTAATKDPDASISKAATAALKKIK